MAVWEHWCLHKPKASGPTNPDFIYFFIYESVSVKIFFKNISVGKIPLACYSRSMSEH